MKSTLLASSALALVLSTGIAFAGPTATITDLGTNNNGTINQNTSVLDSDTAATIDQGSSTADNEAEINQTGSNVLTGTIKQDGTANNTARIDQANSGTNSDLAFIQQDGNNNKGATGVLGSYTYGAYVSQTGEDDSAKIWQYGANSNAYIAQTGSHNVNNHGLSTPNFGAYIEQAGDDEAVIVQASDDNAASITQKDDADVAKIDQSGGGLNTALVEQLSYGDQAYVTQDGTSNTAQIRQHGEVDIANVTQSKTGGLVTIDQNVAHPMLAAYNTANVYQTLNDGAVAHVTQEGTGGLAIIHQ